MLLCWLALLLVRVIETETGASWAAAREALEDLALVTLEGKDGPFQLLSMVTPEQRNLLNKLDLPLPKAPRRALSTPASA